MSIGKTLNDNAFMKFLVILQKAILIITNGACACIVAVGVIMRYVLHKDFCGQEEVITVIAMEIPGLVGGSVIVEQVFSWPGLGQMTMSAVLARDYPVIMAVCLLSAVAVLMTNVLADILYAAVDPAVRFK